jgi:hypothetical protein
LDEEELRFLLAIAHICLFNALRNRRSLRQQMKLEANIICLKNYLRWRT